MPARQADELIEIVLEKERLGPLLRAYCHRDESLPLARARPPPQTDFDFDA